MSGCCSGCAVRWSSARYAGQSRARPLPRPMFRGRRPSCSGRGSKLWAASAPERDAFRGFVGSTPVFAFPNSVDCTHYAAVERKTAAPDAPLRLLYMGRLVREKGLYELLEAVALVCSEGIATELIIAGSGPEELPLRQLAASRGLEHVSFPGPVHGVAKLTLLQRADVSLLPTSNCEGLPYALLESMAAGVPVIATRVGAIPELVTDGVNGLLMEGRSPQAIA